MLRHKFLFFFGYPIFSIYCAKNGKEVPSMPTSEKFENLNLLKRPLNAYIIENGKHAKVEEKSIQFGEENGTESNKNTVKYNMSRPPFAITQRGSVILIAGGNENSTNWPNWHHGNPSIVQMMAANGHCVAVPELKEGPKEARQSIREILEREKLHKVIIFMSMDQKGSDTADELIGINDQLDAIVLLMVNPSEDLLPNLKKRSNELNTNTNSKSSMQIVLKQKGAEKRSAKGGAEEVRRVNMVDAERDQRTVAQLMVNVLDWVHPR